MATTIAVCDVYRCIHNDNGLCNREFITLDKAAHCDFLVFQQPMTDPKHPEDEPLIIPPGGP